jgi:flagellar export protein FliJ
MKRFKFRLNTVLNYSRSIENEENLILKTEQLKLKQENERLTELKQQANRIKTDIVKSSDRGITVQELAAWQAYLNTVFSDINHRKAVVEQAEKRVMDSKTRLIEKMKARKSFEHLKQQRTMEFNYELERTNQLDADERALINYCATGRSTEN